MIDFKFGKEIQEYIDENPFIRRVSSRLLSNDLISVQPLSEPTGFMCYADGKYFISYDPAWEYDIIENFRFGKEEQTQQTYTTFIPFFTTDAIEITGLVGTAGPTKTLSSNKKDKPPYFTNNKQQQKYLQQYHGRHYRF